MSHFGIVYPDELSLAKAVSRLLQHGDLIDDARDHGAMVSVYLRDPDGSGDGNIYALKASTGAKLWSYATGHIVDFSPQWPMAWFMSAPLTTTCMR